MSIHKGDIGTVITIDAGEDLTSADDVKVYVRKPRASSTVEWSPTVSGSDVIVTTTDGDLSEAGTYKIQVWADLTTWSGYSEIMTLEVEDNI